MVLTAELAPEPAIGAQRNSNVVACVMLFTVRYVIPEYGDTFAEEVSSKVDPRAVVALTVQPDVVFANHVSTVRSPGSRVVGEE